MTFSKQLFPLILFSVFIFPLLHASNPRKCSSSYYKSLRCGSFEDPIRFPFCGHAGFNLQCTNLNKTVIELPMSGTFLVEDINYKKQQITISDPEDCLVKRLLTFNTSGSPFSHAVNVYYTFLTCPNEAVMPSWYPSIPCLSNSTSSFFATSNLTFAESMLPSCHIVKRVVVPISLRFEDNRFSSFINHAFLLLEWNSPDCRTCDKKALRCAVKNKTSLQVKCLTDKSGHLSSSSVLIITFFTFGGVTSFTYIGVSAYYSERFAFHRRENTAITTQQPRAVMATIGLAEYASEETVRSIPKCDHIHGSCPICRSNKNLPTLEVVVVV